MNGSNAVALQMPSSYVPMTSEEMEYLEGGGTVKCRIGICCTVGGLVSSALNGLISGMVASITGGLLGGVTAALISRFLSGKISDAVNCLLPNGGGYYSKQISFSVSNALLPNYTLDKYYDIAKVPGFIGGARCGIALKCNGAVVAYA